MTKEEIIRSLKYAKEKHKNDSVDTFETNITLMCEDVLKVLDNCIEIPKDATNGDILKAIFNIKDEQITECNLFISVSEFDCSKNNLCDPHDFFKTWWNAPYKKGDK